MRFNLWSFDISLGLDSKNRPTIEMLVDGTDGSVWVDVFYFNEISWFDRPFAMVLDPEFRKDILREVFAAIYGKDAVAPKGFHQTFEWDENKIRNLIEGK